MELIVNRIDEWFNTEFPEYDHFFICMKLLQKASTNQKRGLLYNKLSLIKIISPSSSQEIMVALDKAIVYLITRGLIEKHKISDFRSDLFITPLGLKVVSEFREVYHATD